MDLRIVELAHQPAYLDTIVGWNLKTWPKPDRSPEDVKTRIFGKGISDELPLTLILEERKQVIGYAAMVLYEKGRSTGRLHWIDAVYVKPELRKKGLGSMLIQAIEKKASALGFSELFALTDIPDLYRKLGWTIVEVQEGNASGVIVSKGILFLANPKHV